VRQKVIHWKKSHRNLLHPRPGKGINDSSMAKRKGGCMPSEMIKMKLIRRGCHKSKEGRQAITLERPGERE